MDAAEIRSSHSCGNGDESSAVPADITQHLPGQPVPEPVMSVQLGVEPGRLPEGDRPHGHVSNAAAGHTGRSSKNAAETPA